MCTKDKLYTYAKATQRAQNPYTYAKSAQLAQKISHIRTQKPYSVRKICTQMYAKDVYVHKICTQVYKEAVNIHKYTSSVAQTVC